MYVNYSGWNEKAGVFSCRIFIDEDRTDHEIHFSDGRIYRQTSPFQGVTADWNHDRDVYTKYGAWFAGEDGPGEFWTPEDMVRAVADSVNGEYSHYGAHVVKITGVTVPPPEKRPRLDDRIRQTEARALHQDIERNRKMKMLGIRPPGEPWAR